MEHLCETHKVTHKAAVFLFGVAFTVGTPLFTETRRSDAQSNCTFSDGSQIAFGHEMWRTGEYEAIPFRISERMVIPPMDSPLEIPAGSYTLFVKDKDGPPWTLIASKKVSQFGMPYPGEQSDLGRTQMGSDVQTAVKDFTAGCRLIKDGPTFLWMQSGRTVAYVKIMVKKGSGEGAEYVIH
jgi:hypothetical protein